MSATLANILEISQQFWPAELADEWDAPGLVTGHPGDSVARVLLSVDVTNAVIAEAVELNCQLVIAHHPFLLRGVKSVAADTGKGSVIHSAIRNQIAIFAAHTNADVVKNGVSDTIAKALGLTQVSPLVATESANIGHGRIGNLETPVKLGELAVALGRLLPPTAAGVRVAGDYEQPIRRVALCGGAGDSFIEAAAQADADVYITSDLRHHPVQDSREAVSNLALIDVSHWASESLWLEVAARQLATALPNVEFVVSDLRTDPWDFTVTQ